MKHSAHHHATVAVVTGTAIATLAFGARAQVVDVSSARVGVFALLDRMILPTQQAPARPPTGPGTSPLAAAASRVIDRLDTVNLSGGGDPVPEPLWPPSSDSSGPRDTAEGRRFLLRSVVKIRAMDASQSGGNLCTGTRIATPQFNGIITAAHCLYPIAEDGAMSPRLATIGVGSWQVPTSSVRVHRAWARCANPAVGAPRPNYSTCAQQGPDIALVPLDRAPSDVRDLDPWTLCSAAPVINDSAWVAYGFGETETARAGDAPLVGGGFIAPADRNRGRPAYVYAKGREAAQGRTAAVEHGDSGGPVLSRQIDAGLSFSVPSVCFVIAARASAPDPGDPRNHLVVAKFQPLYNVDWGQFSAQ